MLPFTQQLRFVGACVLVLASVLASEACAGTLDDPTRFETQAVTEAGLTDEGRACPDIPKDLFVQGCSTAGCHGTADKIQGLDLQSANVASRLVDVRATGGGLLIDPANPSQSVLYTKLMQAPPFGARMPSGKPALDDATLACVLSWVSAQSGSAPSDDGGYAPDEASSGDATMDAGIEASAQDAAKGGG